MSANLNRLQSAHYTADGQFVHYAYDAAGQPRQGLVRASANYELEGVVCDDEVTTSSRLSEK